MRSLASIRCLLLLAPLALPSPAGANSCPGPGASARIAYPDLGRAVGRSCPLTVDNPDVMESTRVDFSRLVVTSGGKPLPFKVSAGQPITGKRYYGCNPNPLQDKPTPVAFLRYLVTPDAPLPPSALVEITDGTSPLARFITTEKVDRENCDTPPEPFGGFCQPPLQECIADAAPPAQVADAGSPPDLGVDTRPAIDLASDAGAPEAPPAADLSPTPDVMSPADAGATPPADAPALTGRSGGCSTGGAGAPAPLLTLLLVVGLTLRRPGGKNRGHLRLPIAP